MSEKVPSPPEPPEDAERLECPVEGCDLVVAGRRLLGWHIFHNHAAMGHIDA